MCQLPVYWLLIGLLLGNNDMLICMGIRSVSGFRQWMRGFMHVRVWVKNITSWELPPKHLGPTVPWLLKVKIVLSFFWIRKITFQIS